MQNMSSKKIPSMYAVKEIIKESYSSSLENSNTSVTWEAPTPDESDRGYLLILRMKKVFYDACVVFMSF